MFLTFEGLDFSGKTTQAKLVVERFKIPPSKSGLSPRTVQFIREPGGTRISERLREILLDKKNLELSQMTELPAFLGQPGTTRHEVILPALERGDTVICDRYYDSTTAYQGYGRGLDLETIHQINALATFGETGPDHSGGYPGRRDRAAEGNRQDSLLTGWRVPEEPSMKVSATDTMTSHGKNRSGSSSWMAPSRSTTGGRDLERC